MECAVRDQLVINDATFFSYGLCVSAVALNQDLSICSKTEKVFGTNCFTPLEKYKITTFEREIPHTLIFYTKTNIRDMSKNKRSLVRMMNGLNIDNQMAASSCSIPSMTSTNQFSHSQQKQQRDRARFFYLQRQKRKQRRLQQGPLHIQHYQQRAPDGEAVYKYLGMQKKLGLKEAEAWDRVTAKSTQIVQKL